MKKFVSCIIVFALLLTLFPVTTANAQSETFAARGTSGNCNWNIKFETGVGYVLYISGYGKMDNYYSSVAPWIWSSSSEKYLFSKIVIEDGITTIGAYAFCGCNFISIQIPSSVKSIEPCAFMYSRDCSSMVIPDSVTKICTKAFNSCPDLKSIYLSANIDLIDTKAFEISSSYDFNTGVTTTSYTKLDHVWFGGSKDDVQSKWWNNSNDGLAAATWHYNICSNNIHTYSNKCDTLCNYCGYKRTVTGGHYFDNDCDAECNECGFIRTISHTYGEWQTRTAATCTEEGEEYHVCSVCGATESQSIPVTGHQYVGSVCQACGDVEEGVWEYQISNNCVVITKYRGTHEEVVVPSVIEGYPVTEIYICAFAYKNMRTIRIPSSVTKIRNGAFLQCENLKEIVIPDSVTEIGWGLFCACSSLESITMSKNITEIGMQTFASCSNLKRIQLPDGITSIGREAFINCTNLEEIIIPNSVVEIDRGLIKNCTNLQKIYYCGTKDEWNAIVIDTDNSDLLNFSITYHDLTAETITIKPTCTTQGKSVSTCSICGKEVTTPITANGHTYNSWNVAPNCTTAGYTAHSCSFCHDFYIDNHIDALGHDIVTDAAVPATCTETGLTEGCHCSRCTYEVAQKTVAVLGHDKIYHDSKTATCTEKGWEAYVTCSRCDYTTYKVIPATGHSYTTAVTAPSCTEQGYTTYTCACGDSYISDYVDALGHDYVDGECTHCGEYDPNVSVDAQIKVTCSPSSVLPGSTVKIEVSIEENPGIVSMQLNLEYDTSKLELLNVEDTGLLSGAIFSKNYNAVPFVLNWNDSSAAENNTANGVIARLTFQIKDDCPLGSIPVEVHYKKGDILGKDLNKVRFAAVNDSVEVVDCLLGDVDGNGGILAKDVASLRRYLAHWSDVNIVEAAADINKDGSITAADVAILRRYLAHWDGVTLSATPTQKATRHTPLRSSDSPTIAISDAEGKTGETVTVKVELQNNPGIVSAYLDLSYDNTKLKLVSVTDTKLLNGALFTNDYSIIPFALNWDDSIASANNTANGVIAELEFEILEGCKDAPATVSISYVDGNILDYDLNNVDFAIKTGTVSVHTHQYTTDTTAPTCTEKGYTTYTCACGDTYVDDYVDALGHNEIHHDGKAATCTEKGWKAYVTCSRCDYSTYKEIPATGHSYTATVTAPTCMEQGYTTYTCKCGDTYVDNYVNALGHDIVTDAAVPATCTETGLTEGSHCSRCDYEIAQNTVAALGHDEIHHDGKAATCTEKGWEAYVTCSRCDYSTYKEIPATGHSYATVVTAPTCTEKGYTIYTCACGERYVANYVDALGHDFVDGECTRCGEVDPDYVVPDAPWENPFVDVPSHAWYYSSVKFACQNGLFSGMSATTFEPDTEMTRAMLVTVLWRMEGKPGATGNNSFTDVPSNMWFTDAVIWASENGIVNGVGNNKFAPDDPITREQMAAILYRYAAKKGYDTSKTADLSTFLDGATVSSWARESLSWANAEGLINGTKAQGKIYLDPQGNATRAQVAAILMRFLQNVAK